jgi:integrase
MDIGGSQWAANQSPAASCLPDPAGSSSDPAAALKCARIGKKDRPAIDPFSIQDAEVVIAALHRDWGEAQGNYDELRFFTGLRPSEEIALVVTDYDAIHGFGSPALKSRTASNGSQVSVGA